MPPLETFQIKRPFPNTLAGTGINPAEHREQECEDKSLHTRRVTTQWGVNRLYRAARSAMKSRPNLVPIIGPTMNPATTATAGATFTPVVF